jgi:hypothetical protein
MPSLPQWVTWEWVDGLLTAGGTAALALYAAVQIREVRRERLQRRVLARRDRRDRQAAALATLRGEFIRLSRLKARWQDFDLAALIAADAISESDLVAPDWRGVTVAIGVLGGATSVLAAIAYGVVADAALQIRTARADIKLRGQVEPDSNRLASSDRERALVSLEQWPARTEQLIADIRQWISDACDLLQEAIWHAPGGRDRIPLDEAAILTDAGRRLVAELNYRPPPDAQGSPRAKAP